MSPNKEILYMRRRSEAARNAAQAAVYIADGLLLEARSELKETLQSVQRLIEAREEDKC
jgi:tellurite resistance protein